VVVVVVLAAAAVVGEGLEEGVFALASNFPILNLR
jgi:hypothetical protein